MGNTEVEEKCPILSKNSRPFKNLEREKKQNLERRQKLQEGEKRRLQGRVYPNKEEAEYEKNLQIIATKGVVRLFNAVSHQQTEIRREHIKDEQLKREFVAKKMELDKSKVNSNDTIVKKIMSREKRWKIFEDEEEQAKAEDE